MCVCLVDSDTVHNLDRESGEQGKMEKIGCKIICGVPTDLAVEGLKMMVMMYILTYLKISAVSHTVHTSIQITPQR